MVAIFTIEMGQPHICSLCGEARPSLKRNSNPKDRRGCKRCSLRTASVVLVVTELDQDLTDQGPK